jgi:hypothetical protein
VTHHSNDGNKHQIHLGGGVGGALPGPETAGFPKGDRLSVQNGYSQWQVEWAPPL